MAQWASLIAQQKASWDDYDESWEENDCSALYAVTTQGLICKVSFASASFMVQTTATEYEIATTRGTNGYIAPEPPAEISSLWSKTVAAATAAEDAGATWTSTGCSGSPSPVACGSASVNFERAIDALRSQFEAWSPYL